MSHVALQRWCAGPAGLRLRVGGRTAARRVGCFLSTRHVAVCAAARALSSSSSSGASRSATPPASDGGRRTRSPQLTTVEMFFKLVSPLIATAPCVTRTATLYGNLPPKLGEVLDTVDLTARESNQGTHRWLRTCFGTLANGLRRLQATNRISHWGVYVSEDGVYVVKACSGEEAEKAFAAVRASQLRFSQCEAESLLEVFKPVFPCFTPPPPPPEPRALTSKRKKKGQVPGGVFTPQMLVPYVPTFFIPMEELLAALPEGYTAAHIEQLFAATGTLEIVTLEGEKFVRLHGGKRLVDFARDGAGEAAHARWREYQPDPFLCGPLHRLFPALARWVPLRRLITGAPAPLLRALLPWERYKTLLFFAQMQHVFSFTPEGEGAVCWVAPVTCLSYHDSPTPAAVSELAGLLSTQRVCIADLLAQSSHRISDHAKTQIIMYYGTLLNFLRAHGDVFCVVDDTFVAAVSSRGTAERTPQTLEDKLEEALVSRNRRTAQKIRRRMAMEKDPDSPYADRDVLLDAILRYVPQKRSISLSFLLRSLPPSLAEFLPGKPLSMFQQAPEKIRVFEYRYRHRLHLIRPGVPLPPGVLRQHYTEPELLFLCAAELQQAPRAMVDLYGRLPYGAKEVIRLQYKGLLELLRPYPHFFTVVFKDALRLDSRNALVTLIQMPPTVALGEEDYGATAPEGPVQRQQLEDEDKAAMQTLPDEIRKTMRVSDAE
ncbi:uncharacterized protein Tco025E_02083 [Trypanosoma conorhini]|uniref:Uncharacterized protein n=1 Tax=Trypanosoma conorhini TaxID=83891 RepID=A0A422Q6T9_9TRYP|nr:uncharacterized protein Tco025E_02083 [Trypanosoma conorhini]RNF25679.1 hypothetical protein Tco025E_02083 [Trypanosoma conorhini]